MTNFLFNIKNHYLRVAIAELVDEAMKAAGRPHYQFSQQWDAGSMAQADVIFTEMVAGEWYLCQDLFQHAPEQYTLFIFPDNEHATVDEGLPNCLQHAVFMPPHARVQRLKDEIANAILFCQTINFWNGKHTVSCAFPEYRKSHSIKK